MGENELWIGQNIFLRMKNDFGMNLSETLLVLTCYMHVQICASTLCAFVWKLSSAFFGYVGMVYEYMYTLLCGCHHLFICL